jgi:hypothetical protein
MSSSPLLSHPSAVVFLVLEVLSCGIFHSHVAFFPPPPASDWIFLLLYSRHLSAVPGLNYNKKDALVDISSIIVATCFFYLFKIIFLIFVVVGLKLNFNSLNVHQGAIGPF